MSSGPLNGSPGCSFGIKVTDPGASFVLWDTILRSAYVVFDLVHNETAVAQAVFDTTASRIVP
jgi:hypothetical protein